MVALTLDLVPQSCWYSNLRSELPRKVWNRLRKATYAAAGHRCEICGGKGRRHPVECHERWSYDEAEAVQRLDGLIALCPRCHEVKHFGLAEVRGNRERAMKHLMRVNDLTRPEAEALVAQEAALWDRRSAMVWDLDVSWLVDNDVDAQEIMERRQDRNIDMVVERARMVLDHPLLEPATAAKLRTALERDPLGTLPYVLGPTTPTGRPTAETILCQRLSASQANDCGTAKPRHPNAPCDRQGRSVALLHVEEGYALVAYPDAGDSSVYLGEWNDVEGVVAAATEVTRDQALSFFQQL